MCVTGQRGPNAVIFAWDSCTGEKKCRMQANGSKAIVAVAISEDNSTIACVDGSNDHNVHVFNAENGGLLWKEKGDQNPIYDISFS